MSCGKICLSRILREFKKCKQRIGSRAGWHVVISSSIRIQRDSKEYKTIIGIEKIKGILKEIKKFKGILRNWKN